MHFNDRDEIIALTPMWKGERLPDGRPKVDEKYLKALKTLTLEEVWKPIFVKGYESQFEGRLQTLHNDGRKLIGRAVTATYCPYRPDLDAFTKDLGRAEGRTVGDGVQDQQGQGGTGTNRREQRGDVGVAEGGQREIGVGCPPRGTIGIGEIQHRPVGQKLQHQGDGGEDEIQPFFLHGKNLLFGKWESLASLFAEALLGIFDKRRKGISAESTISVSHPPKGHLGGLFCHTYLSRISFTVLRSSPESLTICPEPSREKIPHVEA